MSARARGQGLLMWWQATVSCCAACVLAWLLWSSGSECTYRGAGQRSSASNRAAESSAVLHQGEFLMGNLLCVDRMGPCEVSRNEFECRSCVLMRKVTLSITRPCIL